MTTETVAQDAKAEATRPYVAWRTLFNLLERMSSEPPPPRIDRTYLRNLDGNAQTQLMAALRWLGLIETDGTVTSDLRSLLGNAGVRKVALAQIIRNKYPEAIALAEQNATQGQLDDAFRTYGLGGDTLRKAESFFLNAAEYAERKMSSHFKKPRAAAAGARQNGKPPRKRAARPAGRGAGTTAQRQPGTQQPLGDTRQVTLSNGATVTLTVSQSVLSLPRDDRTWVMALVEKLEEREIEAKDEDDDDDEHEG